PLAGPVRGLRDAAGPADRLLGAVPVELLGAAVPARDRPVGSLCDDRVAGRLDDVAEQVARRTCGHLLGDVLNAPGQLRRGPPAGGDLLAARAHDALDVVEAGDPNLEGQRLP